MEPDDGRRRRKRVGSRRARHRRSGTRTSASRDRRGGSCRAARSRRGPGSRRRTPGSVSQRMPPVVRSTSSTVSSEARSAARDSKSWRSIASTRGLDRPERREPRLEHLARRPDDRWRIRVDRRHVRLERRVVVGRHPFGHGGDRLGIPVDRSFRRVARVGIAQVVADDRPEDGPVVGGIEQLHERGGVGDLRMIDGESREHDAQLVAVQVERRAGLPSQVRLRLGKPGPIRGRQVVRGPRVVGEAEDEVVRGPDVPFDRRTARAAEMADPRARGTVFRGGAAGGGSSGHRRRVVS